jgi:hypothetical protein
MSFNTIIDPATQKIFDALIPEGGGVPLQKGQLITAVAGGTEVAFPVAPPANGSVLSYDATTDTGLRYIANNPTALALNYQQLFSATAGNNITAVPASAHNNYVLTSDTDPANPTGLTWKAVAGSGVIQTNDPLYDEEVANVSTISINFGAVVGQIPYGTGVARTGTLTNTPTAGQILGIAGNPAVPTWIPAGGSGTITALAPLTEYAVGPASQIAIDFTAKGDLVVGGGPQAGGNPIAGVILPVGANDMVLTANSGTASGLEWKASGSGSSPIINRNSQDNTPLIITKPTTASDTMILTSDRVGTAVNKQIYSIAGVGFQQGQPQSFNFTDFLPVANIIISSIGANLKLESSAIQGTSMSLVLCALNDPTTIYSTSDPVQITGATLYNFTNFDNLPFEVIANTTYSWYVFITLNNPPQLYYCYYLDPQDPDSRIGNITIVGNTYPAGATATFIMTPPGKFRTSNPAQLAGFNNALLQSFTSQSFVATEDTNDWVVMGATNAGVAFS